ncbi:hypothetical protein ACRRTK_008530 [Alexandromys fortis]
MIGTHHSMRNWVKGCSIWKVVEDQWSRQTQPAPSLQTSLNEASPQQRPGCSSAPATEGRVVYYSYYFLLEELRQGLSHDHDSLKLIT